MDLGLTGKRALVCASSKGLGRGCAEALAAAGVELVINARSEGPLVEAAEAMAKTHGVKVTPIATDITTAEGQARVPAIPKKYPKIAEFISERAKIHVVTWLRTNVQRPGAAPSPDCPPKKPSMVARRGATKKLATTTSMNATITDQNNITDFPLCPQSLALPAAQHWEKC